AGVDDNQTIESLKTHQIDRQGTVRKEVTRGDLRPSGNRRIGVPRGNQERSFGGERVLRQKQTEPFLVEDAGMSCQKQHNCVLWASPHFATDFGERLGDIARIDKVVRQKEALAAFLTSGQTFCVQDLAESLGVALGEVQFLSLVVAHPQSND